MLIQFYQIPKILIGNSTYLGSLVEVRREDLNVDMSNVESIEILLTNPTFLNYISVEYRGVKYYYYLISRRFYTGDRWYYRYKLDVVRTMRDIKGLNLSLNISKFTYPLPMSDSMNSYFWKNQGFKLGSDILKETYPTYLHKSESSEVENVWGNIKWMYLWLQPRSLQKQSTNEGDVGYRYKFDALEPGYAINILSSELPQGAGYRRYRSGPVANTSVGQVNNDYPVNWRNYTIGSLYYATDTMEYYRVKESVVAADTPSGLAITLYKVWLERESDMTQGSLTYLLNELPTVSITDTPNNLHCIALPVTPIQISGFLYPEVGPPQFVNKQWSADNVIPHLLNVDSENSWVDFIVDLKISKIPPIDLSRYKLGYNSVDNTPTLEVELTNPDDNFSKLTELYENVKVVNSDGDIVDTTHYIPSLYTLPNSLIKLHSNFNLPKISKESVLFNKYLISIAEERVELDIVLLSNDGATSLYYYEDIQPGRNTTLIGYAPEGSDLIDPIKYLIHSPSTLSIIRDLSLPLFTPAYQSYIANNKNFMQQAQASYDNQLTQGLLQSGSSLVAGSVIGGVSGSVAAAGTGIAYGISGAIGALINRQLQDRQLQWSIDNMKSASGSYKGSSANLSMMLPLGLFDIWISELVTNELDIKVFNDLLDDVGLNYFNFEYNLQSIIEVDDYTPNQKGYLQGYITGITLSDDLDFTLLNILQAYLTEGVDIFYE